MVLAKRLYELQLVDSEVQDKKTTLEEISNRLGESEALIEAKAELVASRKHLADVNKKRRDVEWEVEELHSNIADVDGKLYGGKVKNPKELLSLEQEVKIFKTNMGHKEDDLLNLMAEEEAVQKKIESESARLGRIELEWKQEQEALVKLQSELENQLIDLNQRRQAMTFEVDQQTLKLYEGIIFKKGQAVVKVEQGRCQGCRLNLSMSELQRVRTGALVKCSSCGMILYLG